jgi:S1-C subfamily serine protease
MWSLSRPLWSRCRFFLLFLVVAVGLPATAASDEAVPATADPAAAVVKIYVAAVAPSHAAPWRPGQPYGVTGSGAVIEGGLILTNAHVVLGHTFVQVRANGSAQKFPAHVAFVSHPADLALLEVDSEAFHRSVEELAFGGLPAVGDRVSALGFPNGGETLSVTDGVVARVEHEHYVHSWESLLSIQMDAAIAPGSSGGPVVRDGRLVGIAMQSFKESAFGCAIPVAVIRQFLEDVADGRLDGIPKLGIAYQSLENPALRASLGVRPEATGVLVDSVFAGSPVAEALHPGDVLLALDGRPIADDGTVEFRPRERTRFAYELDQRQLGSSIRLRLLRDGAVREVDVRLTLARGEGSLVPRLYDEAGQYYVFGGLVFASVTWNYAMAVANQFPNPQVAAALFREQEVPGQQLVALADVLTGDVNRGYEGEGGDLVRAVDGKPVRNLAELVELVEGGTGEFVTFTDGDGERITLARREAVESTPVLLARYGLTADRSPGLGAHVRNAGGETPPAAATAALTTASDGSH